MLNQDILALFQAQQKATHDAFMANQIDMFSTFIDALEADDEPLPTTPQIGDTLEYVSATLVFTDMRTIGKRTRPNTCWYHEGSDQYRHIKPEFLTRSNGHTDWKITPDVHVFGYIRMWLNRKEKYDNGKRK